MKELFEENYITIESKLRPDTEAFALTQDRIVYITLQSKMNYETPRL